MKTKFKQALSTILTLTFILCALSACGTNPDNAIIGKWYNDDGKCLDIRSDGSYKLDDSYGTGTWKYLDDNETVELTDIYGETNETKVEKDDTGEYITFSSYGVFRRKAEDISENEKPSIKINNAGNFSDGVAWITYNDETGAEQLALIDTNGKIIYKETNKCASLPSEMHGISYIDDKDNNYKLITKEGNIIANSQDGTFDSVLAYGDGFALVYKFSGPKGSKHLYGVIDNNGKFILDYMEFSKKAIAEYLGCGIFAIELSDRTQWAIVNCHTGSHIYIGTDYLSSLPKFVNDFAYFNTSYYILENPSDSLLEATQMSYCRLDTNFNISSTSEFQYSSNGLLVDFEGGYDKPISIIEPNTNSEYSLGYNTTQLIKLEYVDNFIFLMIQASDGKKYFTLLDSQAKEQIEPIVYNGNIVFADGKVVYETNETYSIIDVKGNVLAENLEYKMINEFSEDIAVAITTFDEYYYINSKGERVLENIHE